MNQANPTVGIVGGGIIGSWTALHLAEMGVPTTLFEQFPLPHTRGSSGGLSRAFRFLGDLEVSRLDYSLERWLALEQDQDQRLFVKTGLLNFGVPGDPYLEKYMNVLLDNGRSTEWLESGTIAARYPTLNYPEEWGAAWDPSGGILIAHACLSAVQSKFLELGGRINRSKVESIEPSWNNKATVLVSDVGRSSSESPSFDRIVVCAGPWTTRMVPSLDSVLQSILTPVTYWADPADNYSVAKRFPILFNARLTDIYAIPSYEYPGLIKILFHGGPVSNPDKRDFADIGPYIEKVKSYLEKYLPDVVRDRPAIEERCMYTLTPDSEPIIDRLGDGVVVGCGFSGSGFKHSPATGRALAALAMGQEEELPDGFLVDRFRARRFDCR